MGQMRCSCGYVISDTEETEGHLLRKQDWADVFDKSAAKIAAFSAAVKAGERVKWINSDLHEYAHDLPDEDVIYDILGAYFLERALRVSECGDCGNLWIQEEPKVNQYRSYSPDAGGMRRVLKSPFCAPKAT